MPEEKRRISPAVLIIPVGLGLAALVFAVACAALPEVYTCPVCGAEFSTLEELQYHFTTSHPREEIPIEWE